jgi:hypothetical protein
MHIRGFFSSFRHSNFDIRSSLDGFEVSFFEFLSPHPRHFRYSPLMAA